MKARANTESKFLYKYLLIGLATLGYCLYCYYDAFINYPAQRPSSVAYDELKLDIQGRQEAATDDATNWGQVRVAEWKALATENGWSEDIPHYTGEELTHNIQFSIFMGLVCTAIAVPCIIWFLRNKGTWLEIDGTKLTSSNRQTVDFSQIETLDKKNWVKKGLAVINFSDASGQQQRFVLDDLKYERAIVDQMIVEVEEAIGTEKIINGPTESEIKKQREEAIVARQQKLAELDEATDDDA